MLTNRIDATAAYLVRIQENRERRDADAREVADDRAAFFAVASTVGLKSALRDHTLRVRLECMRRARIRSGATCP